MYIHPVYGVNDDMQLTQAIDQNLPALWRVAMASATGARSWPLAWEGYASSSTDASRQALAWARDLADGFSDKFKVRVLEILQVCV